MTSVGKSPSWIGMRVLVLSCVLLAGCSFVTARPINHAPDCSRSVAYADLVIAALGTALATYSIVANDCAPDTDCAGRRGYEIGAKVGVGVGLIEAVQGVYGLSVAKSCEAERAKGGTR